MLTSASRTKTIFADIRFKNNGLEAIEVQDNGAGISSDDYETIGDTRFRHAYKPLSLISSST